MGLSLTTDQSFIILLLPLKAKLIMKDIKSFMLVLIILQLVAFNIKLIGQKYNNAAELFQKLSYPDLSDISTTAINL